MLDLLEEENNNKKEIKSKKIKEDENKYRFISKDKRKTQTQSSILNYVISSKNQNINRKSDKNEESLNISKNKNDIIVNNNKVPYIKKIVSKNKKEIESKIKKEENENKVEKEKEELRNKKNNLHQADNKNFNETLFDYKKYSIMNNNPRKRKSDFYEELKKIKERKDNSIKRKRKGWIRKTFIEKNKNNNENKKIINKNKKMNLIELDIIKEDESNSKNINNRIEESKEEEKENEYYDLNTFNKKFKRSQDDFEVELISESERKRNIKDNSSFNMSKYRQYLKEIEKNIDNKIEYNNNIVNNNENELKLIEDINVKYKWNSSAKGKQS